MAEGDDIFGARVHYTGNNRNAERYGTIHAIRYTKWDVEAEIDWDDGSAERRRFVPLTRLSWYRPGDTKTANNYYVQNSPA